MPSHRRTWLVVTTVCLLGLGATLSVPTASAAGSFTPSGRSPVTGDLTGDGVADTVVLGRFGPANDLSTPCGVQLTDGRTSAVSTLRLPVRVSSSAQHTCPDLGTVMVTASGNRLATATFIGEWNTPPDVQIFGLSGARMVYRAGLDAQYQPSSIGSEDFDGDGYSDLWESTDQGAGFQAWYVRGTSSREFFQLDGLGNPARQFVDLDRRKGIDILLANSIGPNTPARAVAVDGATGRTQVLANSSDADTYSVTVVDIDHDAYPDLRVQSQTGSQPGTPQYFLNRSRGNAFSFVPTSRTPAARA